MTQKRGLIIFIKNPELGHVKTRLAASVGDEEALTIYKKLLDHTRSISKDIDCERFLFYSKHIEKDDWKPEFFQKFVQKGEHLGNRISHAFQLVTHNVDKSVIIGSDCWELTSEIIEQAFEALDHYEMVVGPAKDGGYYLLGLKKNTPELFENIDWSTERVLEQTLDKAIQLNWRIRILKELRDVDVLEDWEEVMNN